MPVLQDVTKQYTVFTNLRFHKHIVTKSKI